MRSTLADRIQARGLSEHQRKTALRVAALASIGRQERRDIREPLDGLRKCLSLLLALAELRIRKRLVMQEQSA